MEEELTPDLCVIGGGSGGLSVAAAAAQLGVSVVLVEKGQMGGDCLNYGCVPSKALLAAAKRADAVRTASSFGIDVLEAQIDHRAIHDHVHRAIANIAPNDSVERFTGLGVRVIQAQASFLDKDTLEAGPALVKARRFVIATGGSPVVPPIAGLDSVPYLTNETIFDLAERVQHLIVLGGGPIGLELGQAYSLLGAEVSIFDTGEILAKEDPEAARIVLKRLHESGVAMYPNTRVDRVESSVQGVGVHFSQGTDNVTVKGSHILVAAGRRPNVKPLNLERAGVTHSDRGIKVNEQLKTSNKKIYAIGDVVGGLQFTHLASYHASIVLKNALFRLKPDVSAMHIPRVMYTDPELAHIGMSEDEARKAVRRIRIYRWPFSDNDRAQCERRTDGFIKVITKKNGTILGVTIVGPEAGELLPLWIFAIAKEMRIGDLTSLVLPYPTFSEISKRVAFTYYQPALMNGWLRRLIGFLRKFG